MSSAHAVAKNIAAAGHQPSQSGQRNGASVVSSALRSRGESATVDSQPYGLTGRVQSPIVPTVSGMTTQTTIQNQVGRMFSGISWAPVMPAQIPNARTRTE